MVEATPLTVRAVLEALVIEPLMVRRLVMVEEALFAMNPPERKAKPVTAKLVEVALVVVLFTRLKLVIVEEAKTMMPPPPFGVMSEPVEVANLELEVAVEQTAEPTRPLVMFKQPSASRSTRS